MTPSCFVDLASSARWELRFASLFGGRGWSFPCDAAGCVDLDTLSEGARHNYLFARALIGREVAWPTVHLARGA